MSMSIYPGCRRQIDHDEDLARALQEKVNKPSYPSYDPTSLFPGEYRFIFTKFVCTVIFPVW